MTEFEHRMMRESFMKDLFLTELDEFLRGGHQPRITRNDSTGLMMSITIRACEILGVEFDGGLDAPDDLSDVGS